MFLRRGRNNGEEKQQRLAEDTGRKRRHRLKSQERGRRTNQTTDALSSRAMRRHLAAAEAIEDVTFAREALGD